MAIEWDQYRREVQGKQDWIGAARGDYGEYLYRARERFARGEAATVRQIKGLYTRVAAQLRTEIENITPGTLRRAHLTALTGALEKASNMLNQEILDAVTKGIRLAVDEAVSGSEAVARELLAGVFDQTEVKWLFADINQRAVMSLLSRTRHDGLKLSDRVWRTSQSARQALQKIVEDGVTRGLDSRKLARMVQQYLQPGVWTALKAETRRRLGVPQSVSMEAMRLAVTEMNNAFHEGTINAYRAIPSAKGIYWRLSHSHPIRDVCDDYASHNGNGFWPKGEEPAKPHPWCRCIAIPAMEDPDEFKERLKAWMQDPGSQPDLEMWYNTTARRFLRRPNQSVLITSGLGDPESLASGIFGEHGWTSKVTQKVLAKGEELRQATRASGVEYAAMVDAETGNSLGVDIKGIEHSVNIAAHIEQMQPGKRYIQIHTHPNSSSFSDIDVALLFYHQGPERNIQSIYVVGADGTRYIMSREPGVRVATPEEIKLAFQVEIEVLRPKWEEKYRSGEMTADQAWKEHTHEAWFNIAKKLGFKYNRLE
ncbi:MAG: hypothetical protein HPY58_12825 [Firmicutes bacterium]|nr:hypothetical protein [Bacillota bacterium]